MEKPKRKSISKKLRFEVFKRDKFICQYCGQKAPDVILVIDHIQPVSKKGTNDIINLITSCHACNSGKSNVLLSDDTAIEKQRKQMEEFEERKQQLKLMIQWQKECNDNDQLLIEALNEHWKSLTGIMITIIGSNNLRLLIKKYSFTEISEAMEISVKQYGYMMISENKLSKESLELAFKKISGICRNRAIEKEKPGYTKMYYLRAILRNRMIINHDEALMLLRKALKYSTYDELELIIKTVSNWNEFIIKINVIIEGYDGR